MFSNARSTLAFTLVELLVVVVVIGILAAIALANFTADSRKAKNTSITLNMRTVQVAAEAYATDSAGLYPANAAGTMLNYMPGGSCSMTGTAGYLPVNPVSNGTSTIGDAGLATSKAIQTLRTQSSGAATNSAGNLSYSQADAGTSYAVTGSNVDGQYITGAQGKNLVLSNQ